MGERTSDERETGAGRSGSPNLKAAMRRVRIEAAAHSGAVDDLRRAEMARLELLEEAVRPVVEQAPKGVDLFDLGIARGEKPRLFLDMIAYADLGPDRRTYRFYQNTRHGRVLIAETARAERIVAAMTNYIARRLLEREEALESDALSRGRVAAVEPNDREFAPRGRLAFWVDALGFLLMTLGAFTLFILGALGMWLLWSGWGHTIGAPHP